MLSNAKVAKRGPSKETHFGLALLAFIDNKGREWHFHRTAIWDSEVKAFKLEQVGNNECFLHPGVIYRAKGVKYGGISFEPERKCEFDHNEENNGSNI